MGEGRDRILSVPVRVLAFVYARLHGCDRRIGCWRDVGSELRDWRDFRWLMAEVGVVYSEELNEMCRLHGL
jgi:hypothetical protein